MSANPTENLDSFFDLHPVRKELGSLYSQITLTCAMCIGSFSYGHILVWNEAALEHIKQFEHKEISLHNWIACVSPLGTALGVGIWGISTIRIGPKKTLIVSTILLILCWLLIALSQTYNFYWGCVLMASFSASSYLFAGEIFLLECVHRNNIKIFFAVFRSFVILGALSMDVICTRVDRTWLCIILCLQSITFAGIVSILPDSPHFLIHKSVTRAENSLKFYMGKERVGYELNMVRQQHFLNFGFHTNKYMLSSKVVIKAIVIIVCLDFFKICTGYYVFLMDGNKIIARTHTAFSQETDSIIVSVLWLVSRLFGFFYHLYGNFGVRKPMMISMCLVSIILFILGLICFLSSKNYMVPINGCMLVFLTIYGVSYDIGMNLCPEITLYAYTPCQIYDFLRKIMMVLQWIILFVVARLYFYCELYLATYASIWMLMCISIVGFIFITMFVIDIKGKSLMNIQMELGGNPVGSRGSIRQRLANPFETPEDIHYLRNLIAADAKTRNV